MNDRDSPNAESAAYWNDDAGPRWARHADAIDAHLAPFVDPLIARSAVAAGERVLDVGCGAGALTCRLSTLAGAGKVLGVDVSETLLAVARRRGAGSGVEFRRADAQVELFDRDAFDRILSRFGVMFFQDSVAAFGNLRRALRPGGTLTFVCWGAREDNPWMGIPGEVVARHVAQDEAPDADAPGPFRFSDPDRIRELCEASGLVDVSIDALRGSSALGGRGTFEQALDFVMEIGPAAQARQAAPGTIEAVRADLAQTLRPHATERGIELDYSAWLVHASRPAASCDSAVAPP